MAPADPRLAAAAEAAAALLGTPVDAVAVVDGGGRNSRVHRVRRGDESFALKSYPSREFAGRDRLQIEIGALRLMADHGISSVPRVVAADKERGYALLEWIDGEMIGEATAADIDEAIAFLAAVHGLRRTAAASRQPLAAEACLSGAEIVAQIERRLARLSAVAGGEPELADFLGRIDALLAEMGAWARDEYGRRGFDFARPLPQDARTLCPSDFGFHNALRRPGGRLAFIDFDYFGRDDPVKLTADFLLHPGMHLGEPQKSRFAAAACDVYGADPDFAGRLWLLYPLFGLRWCMILLNEFLPERWAQRQHAGSAMDWPAAKARQLDRAEQLVHSLPADFRRFPYG